MPVAVLNVSPEMALSSGIHGGVSQEQNALALTEVWKQRCGVTVVADSTPCSSSQFVFESRSKQILYSAFNCVNANRED